LTGQLVEPLVTLFHLLARVADLVRGSINQQSSARVAAGQVLGRGNLSSSFSQSVDQSFGKIERAEPGEHQFYDS
jgi:hypothetical protein